MLRNYCLARLLSCNSIKKWLISVSCSWLFIGQNEREASSLKILLRKRVFSGRDDF